MEQTDTTQHDTGQIDIVLDKSKTSEGAADVKETTAGLNAAASEINKGTRADISTPASVRNKTVLRYVALALVVLIPGFALRSIVDFAALQRLMLEISFGSGLRFWLGVVGATMTALLLFYPLRKAFALRFPVGSIKTWLHVHIALGILGPVLILYHANFGFALRDVNANVALATMLIVIASGFIGQFIYTRASLDFYSARRTVRSRIDALIVDLKALDVSERDTAAVIQRLEAFEREIPTSRLGVIQSVQSSFRIQVQHYQLYRETSALLADAQRRYSWPPQEYQRLRRLIGANLAGATSIARRASGHSVVEQLWSRWRLLHLPLFVVMLIATTLHIRSVWDSRVFARAAPGTTIAAVPGNPPSATYTPDQAINALRRWDETTQALTSGQKFFANSSYAGSASCTGCHQEQHNEWADTWHAKMYRTVNAPAAKGKDNIVIGAFDGQPIKFDKVTAQSEDNKESGAVNFEVVPTTTHPVTGAAGYFFTVRDPAIPAESQTFQVAIVIGGNMEQMYHVKTGDNHFPAPLRWRVAPNGMSAWQIDSTPQPANWIFFRGAGKPNGKPRTLAQLPPDRVAEGTCMGCHTTGYRYERTGATGNVPWTMQGNSVANGVAPNGVLTGPAPGPPGTAAEFGVGCESCHGPGSAHNSAQSEAGGILPAKPKPLVAGMIVHPLKHMSPLQQSMMCGQCHSRGVNDVTPGTQVKGARAANALGFADVLAKPGDRGFLPGDTDLAARIRIFGGYGQDKQGKQAFWPNDWARQGRMQLQDFTKSAHYATGTASCLTCHSGHAPIKDRIDNDRFQLRQSTARHAGTSKTENQCESCHRAAGSTLQPNKEMFEGSVMHQAGVTCINCHMAPVANRTGRTTKTPAKGDGTFDTSAANYGKNFDVSSHTSRVAPTSDSAEVAPGVAMRSACVSCHGVEPRPPVGTQQSDKKFDELFACRKDFVRGRLERLQAGITSVEATNGIVLGKARAEMQFVLADRSWGAHNWDKTLKTLQSAAEAIGASCRGDEACKVSNLVALNTQECSIRTATLLAPRPIAANSRPTANPTASPQVNAPGPAPAQTTVTAQPPVVLPAAPPAAVPPVAAPPVSTPEVTPIPVPSVATPVPTTPPDATPPTQAAALPLPALTVFKDCETCPDMIVAPTGAFSMGSAETEKSRGTAEGPVRKVTMAKPFAASRTAVTRDQFNAFVSDSNHLVGIGCRLAVMDGARPMWTDRATLSYRSPGFAQTAQHPVVCINFADASAYAAWLAAKTGKSYRVLTEAEREYIARAGTTTAYWWGDLFDPRAAAYDTRTRPADAKAAIPGLSLFQGTMAVQSFRPNVWGFLQVHGNVAEWTRDCWNTTLLGLPVDGSDARTGDCTKRVLRGGGWSYWPEDLRSAYREAANADFRYVHVGFRIARDLDGGR